LAKQPVARIAILVLFVALIGVGTFATKAEMNRRQLASAYESAQHSVTSLEQERASLMQELSVARQTMTEQEGDIVRLQTELSGLETSLQQVNQELAALQVERTQLQEANGQLTGQLVLSAKEKEALLARLSSLKELRAAIKDVKRKLRWEQLQAFLARATRQKEIDQAELAGGNRGLVVRGGVSTLQAPSGLQPHSTLRVRVLEPEAAP